MTNILIVGGSSPSYEMTVIAFERYSKLLPISIRPVQTRHVSRDDIKWCDIYICVRGNNPLSSYLCKKAKQQGCKVILMLDDDLLSYQSSEHPLYEKLCKKALTSIVELSDILMTPSKYLGEKYGYLYNKKYTVIDTLIDKEDIKKNWYENNCVRIIYAASHMGSFIKLILPTLNKLFDRYKDTISLTIIGGKIPMDGIRMPVTFIDSMSYKEYRDYMNNNSFDIGCAPLIETEMTKSKYYNKFLEYSTQGICGIYSNTLPYTDIVKDSVNGLLSQNTQESWFTAICRVIDDSTLRSRCVKKAQTEIISKFSIKNITQQLCSTIPWLITYKRKANDLFFIKFPSYPLFLIQEIMRRSMILLLNF